MPPNCVIPNCLSKSVKKRKKGVILHPFPKNEVSSESWKRFCSEFKVTKIAAHDRICSLHFTRDDYYSRPMLKEGAIPSIVNNTIFTPNPAEIPSNKICLKNMSEMEKTLHELKTKLEETEELLKKEQQHKKVIEDRLQANTRKLMMIQGGATTELRYKAVVERLKDWEKALKRLFTDQQIKYLLDGKRPQQWDFETMVKGLRLRISTSKRTYKYLREIENLPLPSIPSLWTWVKDIFSVKPAVSHSIKLLQIQSSYLPEHERLVVMSYGTMPLNSIPCYDSLDDQVYGPCNDMLLVMIHGIHSKWSRTVYFNFNQNMDKILLFKIINDIESSGLQVRGIVSEINDHTLEFWKSLNVYYDQETYFCLNEQSNKKIWIFCDPCQLFMQLRDWTLQRGMTIGGKDVLGYNHFYHVFKVLEEQQWKPCPKLNWDYIQVTGQSRNDVYLSSGLFSATMSSIIRTYLSNHEDAADIILLTDIIFDLLNMNQEQNQKSEQLPFNDIHENTKINIDNFLKVILNTTFGDEGLLPFQKGFAVTLKSLVGLVNDLKEDKIERFFNTSFISTTPLEDLFTQIKTQNSSFVLPNAVESKSRLREYIIETNRDVFINLTTHDKATDINFNEKIKKNVPEYLSELHNKTEFDNDLLMIGKSAEEIDSIYAQLLKEVKTDYTVETLEDFHLTYNQMINMDVDYNEHTPMYIPVISNDNIENQILDTNTPLNSNQINTSSLSTDPNLDTDAGNSNLENKIILHNTGEEQNHSATTINDSFPNTSTLLNFQSNDIKENKSTKKADLAQTNEMSTNNTVSNTSSKTKKLTIIPEKTWADILSKPKLKFSHKWNGKLNLFEDMFNEFHNNHPDHLNREENVTEKFTKMLIQSENKLDARLLRRYVKLRTYIRIRYVLKKFSQQQITIHISI